MRRRYFCILDVITAILYYFTLLLFLTQKLKLPFYLSTRLNLSDFRVWLVTEEFAEAYPLLNTKAYALILGGIFMIPIGIITYQLVNKLDFLQDTTFQLCVVAFSLILTISIYMLSWLTACNSKQIEMEYTDEEYEKINQYILKSKPLQVDGVEYTNYLLIPIKSVSYNFEYESIPLELAPTIEFHNKKYLPQIKYNKYILYVQQEDNND